MGLNVYEHSPEQVQLPPSRNFVLETMNSVLKMICSVLKMTNLNVQFCFWKWWNSFSPAGIAVLPSSWCGWHNPMIPLYSLSENCAWPCMNSIPKSEPPATSPLDSERGLSIAGMYIQREIYQSPACIYRERSINRRHVYTNRWF